MSADNGIYTLVTEGPEFRVIHGQSIDNITAGIENDEQWNELEVIKMFGNAAVFTNEMEANEFALLVLEKAGRTEFGMCKLLYEDRMFPE